MRRIAGGMFFSTVLSLSLLIAGCKVDQAREVARYRQILDGPPSSAPSNEYTAGQPLTLQRSMELADLRNEQLGLQGEAYIQALVQKDLAVSHFLPTVTFTPTYSLGDTGSRTSPDGLITGKGGSSTFQHTLDAPVTGSINLFNGFSDVANQHRAEAGIVQQKELLLDAQETLFLNVAQAFYNVLSAERSVLVLQNSLEVQEASLRDIVNKFNVGLARALDVTQTEANAAAARVSLEQAIESVSNNRNILAFLLDAPCFTAPLDDRLGVPPPPNLTDALDEAQKNRQDLQAAQAAVVAARQQVDVAFGAYYPSVALNVDAFLYKQSIPTDADLTSLLSVSLPIFSAGVIEANVRQAWSLFRQARLTEVNLDRSIDENVKIALETMISEGKQVDELHTELKASEDAYKDAVVSYQNGLATNLDRLTALNALLSAQLQVTTAEYTLKVDYLDLLRQTGQLQRDTISRLPTTLPTVVPLTSSLLTSSTMPALPKLLPPPPTPGSLNLIPPPLPASEPTTTEPASAPATAPAGGAANP